MGENRKKHNWSVLDVLETQVLEKNGGVFLFSTGDVFVEIFNKHQRSIHFLDLLVSGFIFSQRVSQYEKQI